MLRLTLVLGLAVAALASPQWNGQTQRRSEQHQFQTAHQAFGARRDNKAVFIDREEPVVSQEFQEAHTAFSLDVLKNPYFVESLEKYGVVSVSPFSFGHFLAILNEKTFNVPTVNIPKVLHLTSDKVAESYGVLAEAHEDDHKVYITSQVYSPNENLVLTPGQSRLGVHRQGLLFAAQAPSLINSHVRVATHDKIIEALVPNVPLMDKDTTKAVILNTFYFQNYFEQEFLSIGKKPFQAPGKVVDAETVEVIGTFPVYEHTEFYAVAIPMESDGEDKHTVFVLPKTNLKQYLTNTVALETVFKSAPKFWVKKTVRVQLPKVNVTVAYNVDQYIVGENVVCSTEKPDILQPIVQVTNLYIDDEEITYSVTTGSHVTTVKPNKRSNAVPKTFRGIKQPQQYKLEPQYVPHKENFLTVDELLFNKPFFTYFYETTYGPFGYTAVSHVLNSQVQTPVSRHHDNPLDFSEVTKNSRWTCEGEHEH